MAKNSTEGLGTWIAVIFLMIGTIVEGTRVAIGHTDDLRNSDLRWALIAGCLLWAYLYKIAQEDPGFRRFYGGTEILIAIYLTYYQLSMIGEIGWQERSLVDRFAFLVGSVALLSKGLKDVWPHTVAE